MADFTPNARGALTGVRILDLSRLVAGNLLTQVLGDFGAEVVKVEPPAGDTLRAWRVEGVATTWKIHARNKQSLAIEFRHERTRDLLLRLAKHMQVLVESFRPGTLEAMGLAPEVLLAANPSLVIVRISGWGQDGPYYRRPGFGTLIEGMSGFASMNGFGDREPVLPPMYLADSVAGLYGAAAVLMALREVEVNGGNGQVIDLPLFDPLFSVLGPQAANHQLTGTVKPRTGSRSTNSAPRNAYRTSDGLWVCLSASTQGMTERLLRSIGRPELVDDPRFRTNEGRLHNNEELDQIIGGFIAQRTQAENTAFFDAAEVTIGPVYDISQIITDPHLKARHIIEPYPDEDMGTVPMHAVVPRLSGTPGAIRTRAPHLGEHSRSVLEAAGFTAAEVDALLAEGAVFTSDTTTASGESE